MLPRSTHTRMRPRGRARQAVGPHAGDPAPDRPRAARRRRPAARSASARCTSTATCCRPTAARAPRRSPAPSSPLTTRSVSWSARGNCSRRRPMRDFVAAVSVGIYRRRAGARPRLRRGLRLRHRHERRDDRRRRLHRSAGHRRRRSRSRAREMDALLDLAQKGIARAGRRCSSSAERLKRGRLCGASPMNELRASPADNPRQAARDPARCWRRSVSRSSPQADARRAGDGRGAARDLRRERAGQGAPCARADRPAGAGRRFRHLRRCAETARPACTRRAMRRRSRRRASQDAATTRSCSRALAPRRRSRAPITIACWC